MLLCKVTAVALTLGSVSGFAPALPRPAVSSVGASTSRTALLHMEDKPLPALTAAEVEEVGNLVADDEWLGLAMVLAIVVRSAVRESAKKSVREFTGNDECAHECRGSRTHDDQQRAATPGSVLAAHTLHHSPML
jgi:hypothetical protein